jgi:hypothetical protein
MVSKKEKINFSTNDFCTSYTQDIDLFGLFYFCNFTYCSLRTFSQHKIKS